MDNKERKDYVGRPRRVFHRHPESGLKEYETSCRVREELTARAIFFRMVGETGVIAEAGRVLLEVGSRLYARYALEYLKGAGV